MEKVSFEEKHPKLNFLIGLLLLIVGIAAAVFVLMWLGHIVVVGSNSAIKYLKGFVKTTDKVIVVALITCSASVISVLFTSIIAKIVEYRYNVKKYLYDKREEPYKQFIEMTYTIMDEANKDEEDRMPEEELINMIKKFSKDLTLWGSNRVIKKWLKYRKMSINGENDEIWFEMEKIIYAIRKDMGFRRKMRKGNMLSFFINDVENLKQ
ncbi:MAG: hypothetical protein K6E58_04270 [Eubacterium sp.]|nr:hypothetical protein [Eubacterium sp.]